ncbi:hypothetical protein BJ969_005930 [Saccharopolyspora gloriosae]|uniref:Uncharacterized protein n=1 Tax=Saccharopolyspora gloriosae TaxID=455344 RepID=A0A840NUE1_9PSEU|nr:hypothetical protein [Saccharopolyspora gloriosae]
MQRLKPLLYSWTCQSPLPRRLTVGASTLKKCSRHTLIRC